MHHYKHFHLYLLFVIIFSSNSWAQSILDREKISIKLENQSLDQALKRIEKTIQAEFIYDDNLIKGKTISSNISDRTLRNTLDDIFKDINISYKVIQNNRIVLFKTPPPTLRCNIHGRILDASNGLPLSYANVFLSNTTLGCASFPDGTFKIYNIPLGTYELICSMMGYEIRSTLIDLNDTSPQEYIIELKPVPIQGENIQVTGSIPKAWKKHLKKFKEEFIGKSDNAKKCKILNPEILDFEYDKAKRILTATATQPLQIENKSLGYHIEFYMSEFTFQEDGVVSYYGNSRFTPLSPKDNKELRNWNENRFKTYKGSKMHFFRAAFADILKKEKFEVFYISGISDQFESERIEFEASSMINILDKSHEKMIMFPNYLQIYYMGKGYKKGYKRIPTAWTGVKTVEQRIWPVSYIKLNTSPVIINQMGFVKTRLGVKTFGEWADARAADKLPNDYLPPLQKGH